MESRLTGAGPRPGPNCLGWPSGAMGVSRLLFPSFPSSVLSEPTEETCLWECLYSVSEKS